MSYKKFLSTVSAIGALPDIISSITQLSGIPGFRPPELTETGTDLIDARLPTEISPDAPKEDNDPKWFEDGAALIYPQNLFSGAAQAYIYFVLRDSNVQSTEVKKRIGLYMPPGIRVNYGSTWEEINMNVSQSLDTIKTVSGIFSEDAGAQNVANSTLERMGLGGLAKLAGAAIGDDTIGQQLEVASRRTVNPHQALLFKGINFREFEFSFELLARSDKESEDIRKIIKAFKWGMHPGKMGGGAQGAGRYWIYPNTFDVYLLTPSHKYMFNISQCVLTKMDVDYGGSGAASFFKYTGAPVDIRLTLGFKELSVLTKDLIEQDY